jgi:flagellar hook protein FlgE
MGIFDALNTAVSGLQAQSFALQNISGNIANSQTTAFKGTDTEFENLLSQQIDPSKPTSFSGNIPTFNGTTLYTGAAISRCRTGTLSTAPATI